MLLRYTEIMMKWCRGMNLEECNHDYLKVLSQHSLEKIREDNKKNL
jgi:hypothetical protein